MAPSNVNADAPAPGPWWENAVSTGLPLILGIGAFAICFDKIRALAEAAGQHGWRAIAIASTVELLALGAVVEIRKRKRSRAGFKTPVVVLVAAFAMSLLANVEHRGPGFWGLVMAAWPVVAFMLIVTLKATRPVGVPAVPLTVPPVPEQPEQDVEHVPAVPEQHSEVVKDVAPPGPDAEQRRNTVPPVPERDPAIAALLPIAKRVAREMSTDGTPPSGRALANELRQRNHPVANSRIGALADAVAAEWATLAPHLVSLPAPGEVSA